MKDITNKEAQTSSIEKKQWLMPTITTISHDVVKMPKVSNFPESSSPSTFS
jgi:hypothetical protein